MNGPGTLAVENHDDLASRLAALVERQGIAFRRRVQLGTTPYGDPFKVDLLLPGLPAYPKGLAIVARWQEGSGTADQKLLFLLSCIGRTMIPAHIILDGDGWRDGVWAYLAGRVRGPFLGALTVDEFAAFLATCEVKA